MPQMNRGQLRAKAAFMLDLPDEVGSDSRTHLNDWITMGGRRVWAMRNWFERRLETVLSTVAPYVTGTCLFTQGSTTLTGTTTVWTTAMTGRKIALAVGRPWYRFTRTGNTTGTSAEAYAETTTATTGYTIFQDEFDLPATWESVTSAQILSTTVRGGLQKVNEAGLDDRYYQGGTINTPALYADTLATTTGVRRLRVYPIPNAIYRMRVLGLRSFTEMTQDADLSVLGARKDRLLLLATCLEAQRAGDSRAVTSEQELQYAVEQEWQYEATQQPLVTPRSSGRRGGALFFLNDDNTGA